MTFTPTKIAQQSITPISDCKNSMTPLSRRQTQMILLSKVVVIWSNGAVLLPARVPGSRNFKSINQSIPKPENNSGFTTANNSAAYPIVINPLRINNKEIDTGINPFLYAVERPLFNCGPSVLSSSRIRLETFFLSLATRFFSSGSVVDVSSGF